MLQVSYGWGARSSAPDPTGRSHGCTMLSRPPSRMWRGLLPILTQCYLNLSKII